MEAKKSLKELPYYPAGAVEIPNVIPERMITHLLQCRFSPRDIVINVNWPFMLFMFFAPFMAFYTLDDDFFCWVIPSQVPRPTC